MILRRAQNYRMIQLTDCTKGETVGLLRNDGSLGYRRWSGFIDVKQARLLVHAVPVKMAIEAFTLNDEPGARWIALPRRYFLQGSLTTEGVRCVLVDGYPRLVSTGLVIQD